MSSQITAQSLLNRWPIVAVGTFAILTGARELARIGGLLGSVSSPIESMMLGLVGAGLVSVVFAAHSARVHAILRTLASELKWSGPVDTTAHDDLDQTACVRQARMLVARIDEMAARERECILQQRSLERRLGQVRQVLDSIQDPILVVNNFVELTACNTAAARFFDLDLEAEREPQSLRTCIRDPHVLMLVDECLKSANPHIRRSAEIIVEAERERRVFEVNLARVSDADDQPGHLVIALHDVTRERQSSEMKSEFVSKASHELRTPLSSIKAYVEMLLDGDADSEEERQEFCRVIQSEANRLERLIDYMLNISRIEAGIAQADWQQVDLGRVIQGVVEVLTPQADLKEITLHYRPRDHQILVETDMDMMKQVVMNLVSNAIKYTPEGGKVTLDAELTDSGAGGSAMVTVTDTGYGISPEAQKRLFEKFYRNEQHAHLVKGTGLGLNLVKQIVETIHGGEVGVKSKPDEGSTFWFTVPCQRA